MIDLEQQWQVVLTVIGVLMSRMLAVFSVVPLFVGNSLPGFTRIAFVAGLACSLLPLALADTALTAIPLANLWPYIAKEAAIGLVLGLLAGAGFWALYVAGAIIEHQAGLAFAATIDPASGQEESLVGNLLMRVLLTLFLVSGGLLSLIDLVFESYRVWPVSSMVPALASLRLAEVMLGSLAGLIATALKVAAPFVILMLLAELALGFISRFAPQLNVFFIALPLKVLLLAAMLLLYCLALASSSEQLSLVDFSRLLDSLRATPQ